jgi:hypothetical protein
VIVSKVPRPTGPETTNSSVCVDPAWCSLARARLGPPLRNHRPVRPRTKNCGAACPFENSAPAPCPRPGWLPLRCAPPPQESNTGDKLRSSNAYRATARLRQLHPLVRRRRYSCVGRARNKRRRSIATAGRLPRHALARIGPHTARAPAPPCLPANARPARDLNEASINARRPILSVVDDGNAGRRSG